jgi:hypothetical protein
MRVSVPIIFMAGVLRHRPRHRFLHGKSSTPYPLLKFNQIIPSVRMGILQLVLARFSLSCKNRMAVAAGLMSTLKL